MVTDLYADIDTNECPKDLALESVISLDMVQSQLVHYQHLTKNVAPKRSLTWGEVTRVNKRIVVPTCTVQLQQEEDRVSTEHVFQEFNTTSRDRGWTMPD